MHSDDRNIKASVRYMYIFETSFGQDTIGINMVFRDVQYS